MKLRRSFYRALREVAPMFKWRVKKGEGLRATRGNRTFCPITALYYARTHKYVNVGEVDTAGLELNLDYSLESEIMCGADSTKCCTHVRKSLLRAVGLT